jgi:hypothetical protein
MTGKQANLDLKRTRTDKKIEINQQIGSLIQKQQNTDNVILDSNPNNWHRVFDQKSSRKQKIHERLFGEFRHRKPTDLC